MNLLLSKIPSERMIVGFLLFGASVAITPHGSWPGNRYLKYGIDEYKSKIRRVQKGRLPLDQDVKK